MDKKRGFTLIEVLIVIAVVGILAAITFAAFSRAKSSARRTSCGNNLRQIGLACEMYASDHTGRYPNAPTSCAWADRIFPYVKDVKIFECPSARNSPYMTGCSAVAGTDNLDEFGQPVNFHGGYDMALFNNKAFPKSSIIRSPSANISVIDGSGNWIVIEGKDLSDQETFESSGIMKPRHEGGSNALFFDGHVKWVTYESLREKSLWTLNN